jgi:hypothetical protein
MDLFRGARRCVAFALGLLIPRARPAPLSFPGISFPPWEVRCILGYREVGYVRRFTFLAWDGLARPGPRIQG